MSPKSGVGCLVLRIPAGVRGRQGIAPKRPHLLLGVGSALAVVGSMPQLVRDAVELTAIDRVGANLVAALDNGPHSNFLLWHQHWPPHRLRARFRHKAGSLAIAQILRRPPAPCWRNKAPDWTALRRSGAAAIGGEVYLDAAEAGRRHFRHRSRPASLWRMRAVNISTRPVGTTRFELVDGDLWGLAKVTPCEGNSKGASHPSLSIPQLLR